MHCVLIDLVFRAAAWLSLRLEHVTFEHGDLQHKAGW
jgi:hypothetical protein